MPLLNHSRKFLDYSCEAATFTVICLFFRSGLVSLVIIFFLLSS